MFRFHGGQPVGKGTYWNLTSGERIDIREESRLPGTSDVRYIRLSVTGVFIAAPLAGLVFTCIVPFLFLLLTLLFLPRTMMASESPLSGEAQACLGCHSTPGMSMTFGDKSSMSVHVDANHFQGSVHSVIECTSCHSNVSLDTHPNTQYASRQQFLLNLASACKTCHADEQLMANPLHQRAITKANAPPCSECHGSHAIRKVPTQKEKLSTTQYCLTCHKQQLSKSIGGTPVSLNIDERGLRGSVHANHECTNCHTAFSKTNHPVGQYGSVRELTITASETCKRCHFDKAVQHTGSIHAAMLSRGNRNAPVCADCHGSHAVGRKALAETMSGVPCRKCHQEVFEAYKGSVHGSAKQKGTGHAPICSNCHSAHDVKPALASLSPKDMCMGCHADVTAAHKEWLPNAEAHFDAVACTACHVPRELKRTVYIRVTDTETGEMVSEAKMREYLGSEYQELTAGNSPIEANKLWTIYRKLNGSGGRVHMDGAVSLNDGKNAHRLASKMKAVRQCEYCHSAGSEFFKAASIVVSRSDGREKRYSVDSAALGSVFAVLPLNQFYVLGGTRLRILDIVGVIMLMGGMAVPVVHGALRVATARIRRGGSKSHRKEGRP
jgi:hypothetical protein